MSTLKTFFKDTIIYGLNDRYRGIFNERRVVLMNKQDMQIAGLKKVDVVDLWNELSSEKKQHSHHQIGQNHHSKGGSINTTICQLYY